jgi:hypothetical protein
VTAPRTPSGLGGDGEELWTDITGEYSLRFDELRVLEAACREWNLLCGMEAQLNSELDDGAWSVKGSMGQDVANPLLAEIARHRALFARLMAQLKLPDADAGADSPASRSEAARAMAHARWSKSS